MVMLRCDARSAGGRGVPVSVCYSLALAIDTSRPSSQLCAAFAATPKPSIHPPPPLAHLPLR